MDFKAASKRLLLAVASAGFALTAFAQWQWLDKDGRRVFSDRSPPAEVQDKDILKRPPGSLKPILLPAASDDASAAVPDKPAGAKPGLPKLSGKDADLETRKKKADDEVAARKKTEDDKLAKSRADNCERAKTAMATLQSGVRMSSINAQGEREVFDDVRRASEIKRTQDVIDSSCK
jgi:hypothetical protein